MQGAAQALERGGISFMHTWASQFRTTFQSAIAQGISVPQEIVSLLSSQGTTPPPPPPPVLQDGELLYGETNTKVVALQKFLIASASGPVATRLKNTGATGYFGPLTKSALIEYQAAIGLDATGTVDDETYTHIFELSGEGDSSDTEPDDMGTSTPATYMFTRDLEFGMKGEDVRQLQVFLNTHGFPVTSSGDGSVGNETTYFGSLTRIALSKYQAANSIAPSAGYFGPKTRAHVAAAN
jgi:peptidoglycan hydrolase-like protein with peptidoglycan-binding domain